MRESEREREREIMLVSIPRYSAAHNAFVRAERKGEWALTLNLRDVNRMMPYFYDAVY